jgi:hypothetical protein
MVIAWHDAAFTLPEPVLTPDLMRRVLKKFQLQHALKATWSKEEAAMMEKMLNFDTSRVVPQVAASEDPAAHQES